MSNINPFELLVEQIRAVVREEIKRATKTPARLIDPEQLARRLKVPVSWVYEQSRLGNIPTVRIGKKYIRFDFKEVLESERTRDALARRKVEQ